MITNAAVSAELARGRVLVYDAITITVARGRVVDFGSSGGSGYSTIFPIEDRLRFTSCPYALQVQAPGGGSPEVYTPLSGATYSRSRLKQQLGREVSQIGISFAGAVPVMLRQGVEKSVPSFATSLQELARVGLLNGSHITINQVVMPDGAVPSSGYVPIPPVRKFAGVIRRATPSMETLSLECVDEMILGGGSVPVGVFSPECPWGFCDGVWCPVAMRLHSESPWAIGTHLQVDGTLVTLPSPGAIRLPINSYLYQSLAPWGMLVPQDGPMMGMQIQLGAMIGGDATSMDFQLADSLPWAWSCTTALLEFQCSKTTENPNEEAGNVPPACSFWNMLPPIPGRTSSLTQFGGHPDMPQPEGV